MMDCCLLDTNTVSDVIDLSRKRSDAVTKRSKAYLRAHGRFSFSEISWYEILRGLRKKRATVQEQRFHAFCRNSERISIISDVLDRAATLWAEGRQRGIVVDDADVIVAATALIQGMTVATSNTRHFDWIGGLKIVNRRDP